MNIELVRLTDEYREQLFEMLTEWKKDIMENHADMSPWKIWANDFHDFDRYLNDLDTKDGAENEELLKTGGHIGDGIRPSERRKGYATAMIALALDECKKLGISRVLMCCDKDNVGSVRSIIKNGGVLENEVEGNGHIVQRYWIQLY